MRRQLFEYHPTIGYRFIPGLKTREPHEGGGFLLRTNRDGYRCGHEFVTEKPPGTFRVLLFGDSYTAGMGVSDRQRYGDLLESQIPNLEVYNFGMPGTGTDQQYLMYREDAAHIEHDLVVIAVMVENIQRVQAKHRPYATLDGDDLVLAKPYFERKPDGSLELQQVPVPRKPLDIEEVGDAADSYGKFVALRKLANRFGPGVKDRLQRLSRFQPLPAYNRADDPGWLLMKAILDQWLGELRKPAILVPVPLYQYVEKSASARAYQARFSEFEGRPGVTLHDPLAEFHAHSRAERRGFRFLHDCHLTVSAHRLMAESLARAIRPFMTGGGERAA